MERSGRDWDSQPMAPRPGLEAMGYISEVL